MKTLSCHLCGKAAGDQLCASCRANFGAKYQPIICNGCRALNFAGSVTWVDRKELTPEMQAAIISMQEKHGVVAFVRLSCPTCSSKEK